MTCNFLLRLVLALPNDTRLILQPQKVCFKAIGPRLVNSIKKYLFIHPFQNGRGDNESRGERDERRGTGGETVPVDVLHAFETIECTWNTVLWYPEKALFLQGLMQVIWNMFRSICCIICCTTSCISIVFTSSTSSLCRSAVRGWNLNVFGGGGGSSSISHGSGVAMRWCGGAAMKWCGGYGGAVNDSASPRDKDKNKKTMKKSRDIWVGISNVQKFLSEALLTNILHWRGRGQRFSVMFDLIDWLIHTPL